MINSNKSKKDYLGLSLKTAGVLLYIMLFFMFLAGILDIEPQTTTFEVFRFFILGSYGLMGLSLFYFFISVTYTQFKDNRFLWAAISLIFLILYITNYGEEGSDYAFIYFLIAFVSCSWYYSTCIRKGKKGIISRRN